MATLLEIRGIFGNGDLQNKIEVACIIEAESIRTEDPGTVNHANRVLWAKKAFATPGSIRTEMLMALLAANSTLTVAQLLNASDAAIQEAVHDAVNVFADGS